MQYRYKVIVKNKKIAAMHSAHDARVIADRHGKGTKVLDGHQGYSGKIVYTSK